MKRVFGFTFVCFLLIVTGLAMAQQDFSKVEMKTTHVRGAIYMLEGYGGNIGVSVGPDGILIVDDQFAPLAEKIRAALKDVGGGKLKFILNTHWHGDHSGASAAEVDLEILRTVVQQDRDAVARSIADGIVSYIRDVGAQHI